MSTTHAEPASPEPTPSLLDAALAIADAGWPVFPCSTKKTPVVANGFLSASIDPTIIRRMFSLPGAALIGVPTGPASGFDVLDLDYRHGAGAFEADSLRRLPETRIHGTQSGGRHMLFVSDPRVRNSASRIAPGVDVRGTGGYICVPPSPGYSVIHNAPLAPWPEWLLQPGLALPRPPPTKPASSSSPYVPASDKRLEGYRQKLLDNVRQAAEGEKHDRLRDNAISLGGIAAEARFSDDDAVAWLLDALAGKHVADWKLAENTARWGLAEGRAKPIELEDRPRPVNGSSHARPEPPPSDHRDEQPHSNGADAAPDEDENDNRAGERNDDLITEGAVVDAFAHQHRRQLRFDHQAGKWFVWGGTRWKCEETKLAYRWAHQKAKALAADTENARIIIAAGKAAFAAGVERLAQSDRAFAVTSEIWDADPWLLGTPGGTVDLRTGTLRPAAQSDYITKTTAVAPTETPDCPMWLAFLDQACGDDAGYIRFLRQWCGYSLTGSTREHAFLFLHGPGGNGKGVWLNTVSRIIGDYCAIAAMDTFIAAKGDRHPTDLAALKGARMVCASETEEGRQWSEVRIKQLTGGDKIAARFMRQDFFEFIPQFKLTIIGNHQPELRNVDDAAKRRVNMGPFLHKPPIPDRDLEEKLRAEWPGILRWMIDGCLDWQANGLVRPAVVTAATAEYFDDQDLLTQWIDECCERTDRDGLPLADTVASLFASWRCFAKGRGEELSGSKGFSNALQKRGFARIKDKHDIRGRGFLGIKVRVHFEPPPPDGDSYGR